MEAGWHRSTWRQGVFELVGFGPHVPSHASLTCVRGDPNCCMVSHHGLPGQSCSNPFVGSSPGFFNLAAVLGAECIRLEHKNPERVSCRFPPTAKRWVSTKSASCGQQGGHTGCISPLIQLRDGDEPGKWWLLVFCDAACLSFRRLGERFRGASDGQFSQLRKR